MQVYATTWKACLLFCSTSSNRSAKGKKTKVKPEACGEKFGETSNDKENAADTPESKPNIHELSKAPKLPLKVTRKAQDQAMTREIITSLLSNEEDEVDVSMSGFGKRIKKSLDANDQEECLMEIGDVVNRYIRAARFKKNPTSSISQPNAPNVSDNFVRMQTEMNMNMTTQQQSMSQQCVGQMPSMVRMGEVVTENNSTYYNM